MAWPGLLYSQQSPRTIPVPRDSMPEAWAKFIVLVDDGSIILNWKVAPDGNIQRYEIQRTSDTTKYSTIGKIKPLSTSTVINTANPAIGENSSDSLGYTFKDFTVIPNTVYYYRICRVGKGKKTAYSAIARAKASDPSQRVSIYPNPANTFVYVSNTEGEGTLRIYDQSGRIVLEASLSGDPQQVNVSTLTTGSYYARIDREGKVQYRQVLIIN